uniref:Fibronectin type-II domain-containing protein n=1 Tax=Pseudonaja textilis TaxID=8673 RepID=A0A670ZK46_PSETE
GNLVMMLFVISFCFINFTTKTTFHGGNSGGKSCVFPFVYKNQTFYTCTKEEKGRFWCATTRNYDKDLEWSYCADTNANPKGPCVFPFIFNHTSYSSCTTDGISNKKPWCSLTKNYDIDFQWTYCEPSGRMVACKGFIVYFFVLSEVMFT